MMSRGRAPMSDHREPRVEDMEPCEILGNLRAKLLAPGIPDAPWDHDAVAGHEAGQDLFGYGHDIAGLHLVAALGDGAGTRYLHDADMERLGHDAAWSASINNLFSVGVSAPEQRVGEDGAFFCLDSDAVDHATWIAFPDELFSRLGFTVGVQGAFMSAPASGILNLHVIGEGTTFGDLHLLANFTAHQYAEHPSAFSPHLYWWDGFATHQLDSIEDERFGRRLPAGLDDVLVR